MVPCYREPGLEAFHRRLVNELNYWWAWDLVYSVGDWDTLKSAMNLALDSNLHNWDRPRTVRVRMQSERGLGEGVRIGLEAALQSRAKYVVTMEADGSNDPADIRRLVSDCENHSDISVADKSRGDSRPLRKRVLSAAFKTALRLRYGLEPADYNHLFKCYRRDVVEALLPRMRYKGYEGVPETVVRARQAGFWAMTTVPTVYGGRLAGESKLTARKMIAMGRLLLW